MDFLTRGGEYLSRFPDFLLVGRDAELQRLISILMRGRSNSAILLGSGGVGCSSICIGIQAAKSASDAPFDLVNKRLFWLDTNGLFSSGNGEQTSHAFSKIIGRLTKTPESILIIDDTRDFIEAARNGGSGHFINALLAALRERRTQIILEVKDDDLDLVLKSHSDIKELFTVLPIDEPVGDSLLSIVRTSASALSKHHGIKINGEAIRRAIELTNKYRSRDARSQPERSITLLDRALAAYRLDVHRNPPGLNAAEWKSKQELLQALYRNQREGEIAITALEEQLDALKTRTRMRTQNSDFPNSLVAPLDLVQSPEEAELRSNIKRYQAAVDHNKKGFESLTSEINANLELTSDLVLTEFSDISGIPASKLNQNEIEKLRRLEGMLGERIYGQDEVIRRVANGIKVGRVGRRNSNKPLAAYLFLGPSGVGKTELSKVLAGAILDDEAALTRFDMSEYMEKHAVAKLIGAPPGYEGFEVGGILTNLMRKNPSRVLLYDEIEKAHPDIFNIMLQVLEDGRLTDNVGRTVSFSDSIIIMTTNIGQTHFLDPLLSAEEAEAEAMIELASTYRSEFLNRFAGRQNILCFKKLGIDSIKKIALREIAGLDATYCERGIRVDLSGNSLEDFCADQYDPLIGARGLPGFISSNLEPIIVDAVLQNKQGTALVGYNAKTRNFEVDLC